MAKEPDPEALALSRAYALILSWPAPPVMDLLEDETQEEEDAAFGASKEDEFHG